MKKPLKVSPLVKYTLPKYPAFNDANPMNVPKEAAAKAGYYKMALFSVVSLFTCNPQNMGTIASVQKDTSTPPPPKENPIKFEELGFPHTYAMFGTGMPARLDRETAVGIIDSLFKENELSLKKDQPFSQDGIAFNATGYNEKLGIGYVWLDGENTAPDCYRSWRDPYYEKQMLPEDLKVYQEIGAIENREDRYTANKAFFTELKSKNYYKLLSIQRTLYNNEELSDEILQYIATHPNKNEVDYGEAFIKKYHAQVVDLEEMQKLVTEEKYHIGTLKDRCSTWCSCINYASTRSVSKASPVACYHEKMLIPLVDEMSNQLWKEKNQLFIQKHYNPLYSFVAQALG